MSLRQIGIVGFLTVLAHGQELSGTWKLNPSRSDIRDRTRPPDAVLKLEHGDRALKISTAAGEAGPFLSFDYPLKGNELKQKVGDSNWNTRTKWEGSALLVNTLVSGPQSYAIMERWKLSRDRSTLTVTRTIARISGEVESVLVYENPEAPKAAVVPEGPARPVSPPADRPAEYTIAAGTHVLLSLVNQVDTRHVAPGDRVYLQTEVPVFSSGRLVIPRGSYVYGTVTESKRAGRVGGKASLYVQFDTLTLPNGVTRDLRSRMGGTDHTVDREGKITGDGAKGNDTRTVAGTAAAGASIGSIATRTAGGTAVGAAAGAAAGLIGVLASRGPDVVLPRGSTMELVIDRELRFSISDLEPAR